MIFLRKKKEVESVPKDTVNRFMVALMENIERSCLRSRKNISQNRRLLWAQADLHLILTACRQFHLWLNQKDGDYTKKQNIFTA